MHVLSKTIDSVNYIFVAVNLTQLTPKAAVCVMTAYGSGGAMS